MHRLAAVLSLSVVTLAMTIVVGAPVLAQDSPVRFEVASVKPNVGTDLSIPFRPPPPDGITTDRDARPSRRALSAESTLRVTSEDDLRDDARARGQIYLVGDDRDMHRFALFDGSVGSGARPPRPRLSRYTL